MLTLIFLLSIFFVYLFYQYRILKRIHGSFEIQLTLGCGSLFKFKDLCERMRLKPIIIELPYGEHPKQFMTSSWVYGTDEDARMEAERLCHLIKAKGISVERVKIEAHINNLGVPEEAQPSAEETEKYFEFHVKVKVLPNEESKLKMLLEGTGAHLSTNSLHGETGKKFVTLRCHKAGKQAALDQLETLLIRLKGYQVVSVEREFCLYDSKLSLDKGWIE